MTDADPFVQPDPPAPPVVTDRGITPIASRAATPMRWISLAALGLGCGVFLMATWDRGDAREAPLNDSDDAPRQLFPFDAVRRSDGPLLSDAATDPYAPSLFEDPAPPAEVPNDGVVARTNPGESPAETARRSPLLVYSRSGSQPATYPARSAETPTSPAFAELDPFRTSGPIARVRAGRSTDRNLSLLAGATLPCVLLSAVDSATPGLVSCLLPTDVYSEAGTVILLERGTRVIGDYRGGLQHGRDRLFVLWSRAVSPSGVSINLASPAADALGRSGFDGDVDVHFWDRVGDAALLTVLDGASRAAFDDGEQRASASNVGSAAIRERGGITPTLRKAQGSEVAIVVAQDLDFSGVYRLRSR